LFVTVALSAFRRRKIKQLLATLGATALTAGVSLTVFWVQTGGRKPRPAHLGEKYDVYSLESAVPGQLQWLLEKTMELAALPARLESFWVEPPATEVFAILQVALCLLGLAAIGVARRWDWAGLWVSTWLFTILIHLQGRWPYGVFRANLFLLAYGLVLSLAGLDALRRWMAARPGKARGKASMIVPVYCAAFVLAFVPLDVGFFAEGKSYGMAGNCHVHHALEVVYEAEREEPAPARQRRFLLDDHAHDVYRYYVDFHAVASERYQDFFRERYRASKRYQPIEEAIDRQAARGFWLLSCGPGPTAELLQYVLDRCPQVDHVEEFRHGGLLLRCRVHGDPPQ
jgi:hypothetical protein